MDTTDPRIKHILSCVVNSPNNILNLEFYLLAEFVGVRHGLFIGNLFRFYLRKQSVLYIRHLPAGEKGKKLFLLDTEGPSKGFTQKKKRLIKLLQIPVKIRTKFSIRMNINTVIISLDSPPQFIQDQLLEHLLTACSSQHNPENDHHTFPPSQALKQMSVINLRDFVTRRFQGFLTDNCVRTAPKPVK